MSRVDQLERRRWQPARMSRLMWLVIERGWRWVINPHEPTKPCLVSRSGKVFDVRVVLGGAMLRRHVAPEFFWN